MFKTLTNLDLRGASNVALSAMFKTPLTRRPEEAIDSLFAAEGAATEGFFFKSKEEKVAEFKKDWERYRDHCVGSGEKLVEKQKGLVTTMREDIESYKKKLEGGVKVDLANIRVNGLSYTDLAAGLEATVALPDFVHHIFSLNVNEIYKDGHVLYGALKSVPSNVKRGFVLYWDEQAGALAYEPEYHFRNGSKIHDNESLDRLGYTSENIGKIIADLEHCVAAHEKIAALLGDLRRQFDTYEKIVIEEIHKGASQSDYWPRTSRIFHVLYPFWYDTATYSLRGFPSQAMVVLNRIAARA
jgi:hypothetical protein